MPHFSRKPNIDGPTIKIGIPPWEVGDELLILRATLITRMGRKHQKNFLFQFLKERSVDVNLDVYTVLK